MEIDPMLVAELPAPHAYVYRPQGGNRVTRLAGALRPGGGTIRLAALAFAVRHPTAGTILIDTGMHRDTIASVRGDFGLAMGLLFRDMRPAEQPFDEQLRALGIDAGRVERAIMTHLHVDHTSGMRLLPRATFISSRREWEATRGRMAAGKGYVAHHLPAAARMQLVDFDAESEPYGAFAHTIDLLGDGTIRLISTPGHTVGHLSVLLRGPGERQVLLIGDAAYTLRNVREQILPLLSADDRLAVRSMREIEAFAEGDPAAILVPSHDPSAWHELRHVSDWAASARAAL